MTTRPLRLCESVANLCLRGTLPRHRSLPRTLPESAPTAEKCASTAGMRVLTAEKCAPTAGKCTPTAGNCAHGRGGGGALQHGSARIKTHFEQAGNCNVGDGPKGTTIPSAATAAAHGAEPRPRASVQPSVSCPLDGAAGLKPCFSKKLQQYELSISVTGLGSAAVHRDVRGCHEPRADRWRAADAFECINTLPFRVRHLPLAAGISRFGCSCTTNLAR
eukprot:gene3103-biopygen6643